MPVCRSIALWVVLSVAALEVRAQGAGRPAPVPIRHTTYVAFNPLAVPFNIGSIEAETGVAQGITMGATASYTESNSQRFTSGDLKARYYPGEVVLRGFSVGLTAGYLRYSDRRGEGGARETLDAATLGLVTDYNWLLGGSERFVIGTGLGAKRVLTNTDLMQAYVTIRWVIGFAF